MRDLLRATLVILFFVLAARVGAQADERGNIIAGQQPAVDSKNEGNTMGRRFLAGAELSAISHAEEGLDRSKGEYSVSYSTLGGSLVVRYDFPDFFLQGGLGLMRVMSLTVNSLKVDMAGRVQWHVPVYAHIYYRIFPIFNIGTGITHLTETTLYVNGTPAPETSYNHLFLDGALQLAPRIAENVTMIVTATIGLNLIPGRQHTYSVGDLLHLRVQLNLGALYHVF